MSIFILMGRRKKDYENDEIELISYGSEKEMEEMKIKISEKIKQLKEKIKEVESPYIHKKIKVLKTKLYFGFNYDDRENQARIINDEMLKVIKPYYQKLNRITFHELEIIKVNKL